MESKTYRWKYETEHLTRGSRIIFFYKIICPDCDKIVTYDSIERKVKWNYCPYCGSKISEELSSENALDIQEEDGTSSI